MSKSTKDKRALKRLPLMGVEHPTKRKFTYRKVDGRTHAAAENISNNNFLCFGFYSPAVSSPDALHNMIIINGRVFPRSIRGRSGDPSAGVPPEVPQKLQFIMTPKMAKQSDEAISATTPFSGQTELFSVFGAQNGI